MNQILLCSGILLLHFTVANCITFQQNDTSISHIPSHNDVTNVTIPNEDLGHSDSNNGSIKSDVISDDTHEPRSLTKLEYGEPPKRKYSTNKAIRALQQKLALEKSSSAIFRNISVSLMKELEDRKSEIYKARQSNLDLEVKLNEANSKLLELNLELQDARRAVKPCDKKKSGKNISQPNNQLQLDQIRKNYRNTFVKLLYELRLTINTTIGKFVSGATPNIFPDFPLSV